MMQALVALISCATLLFPAPRQTGTQSDSACASLGWQARHVHAVVQRPAPHPYRGNPLFKSAHEAALAEEDSTGPNHDLDLSQDLIQRDTAFTLDISAPGSCLAFDPQSRRDSVPLRC
jgi:hypothetical protein